jgi:hypothetical protein
MEPVTMALLYAGSKVAKGIGNYSQAKAQQKAAGQTPLLTDNDYSSSYGNYIKQYAASGPFSPSQQANFSREVMGQTMPGFNQAYTGMLQRGASTGLEDSAVQGEQLAGIDQNKAMARLNIARRLANKNQELRLSYVDKLGSFGKDQYMSQLSKHRNRMATAGSANKALWNMGGDALKGYADGYEGSGIKPPWETKAPAGSD